MEYPLAHDDSGSPLDVPANAAGWLVRRHSGGRGRPAAVYDGDGRPLVVPLESTAAELRACGCKAGMYRLDAVDASRRALDVVAYTEVSFDGPAEDGSEPSGGAIGSDAAVAALARAVEAMQRVQAERERAQAERDRVQAEMIAQLIERLAPPPPETPRNVRDVLGEYTEAQKIIRKLTPDDEEGDGTPDALTALAPVLQDAVKLGTLYLQERLGLNAKGPRPASSGNAEPTAASATNDNDPIDADKPDVAGSNGSPQVSAAEVEAKLEQVFALLTDDEARQVRALTARLPSAVLDQAIGQLMTMSPAEAAAQLRQHVGGSTDEDTQAAKAAS